MATTVKAGYAITPGAAEVEYTLDQWPSTDVQVLVEVTTGSVQFAVGDNAGANRITGDSNFATLSTAGDKMVFSLTQGKRNLFAKGTGTFRISW